MPGFSQESLRRLATCDPRLQQLFQEVVKVFDCTVLPDGGHRSEERQAELFAEKRTKLKSGGKHNAFPSMAVDVAPYPVDWNDTARFYYFGGFVMGMAASMGIPLRYGGDWNADRQVSNEGFKDLPHFEIVG